MNSIQTLKQKSFYFLLFCCIPALLCLFSEKNIPLFYLVFLAGLPCFFIASYYAGLIPTSVFAFFIGAPILVYRVPIAYNLEAMVIYTMLLLPIMIIRPPTLQDIKPLLIPLSGYGLMVAGFAISFVYSSGQYGDQWFFPFSFDVRFLVGMLYSYFVFMVLSKRKFSPGILVNGIIAGCIVFIVIAAISFVKESGFAGFLNFYRFGSTTINANAISSLLELALPFPVLWALEKTSPLKRCLYISLSLIFLLFIILTQSRGGFIMITILGCYLIYKEIIYKKRWTAGIIMAVLSSALFPLLANGVLMRLTTHRSLEVMSDVIRLYLYKTAITTIKANHYIFGIGMNGFSKLKYNYGLPHIFGNTQNFSSHNQFLEIWVSWGGLGILGWLIVIISSMAGLLKAQKTQYDPIRLGCFFSLLFYFVHGMFDCQIASFFTSLFHFSLLGLAFYFISSAGPTTNKIKVL